MSCLTTSSNFDFSPLQGINSCVYNIGGVKRVFIAGYKDLSGKYTTTNGKFISTTETIDWQELDLTREGAKFTENALANGNLEQIFDMEILQMNPSKRITINSLLKGKFFFIYQDFNDYYWFVGLESGVKKLNYTSTSDTFGGVNSYKFTFRGESSESILGVDPSYITPFISPVYDCGDLNDELALTSSLLLLNYSDCLVGDLTGFSA